MFFLVSLLVVCWLFDAMAGVHISVCPAPATLQCRRINCKSVHKLQARITDVSKNSTEILKFYILLHYLLCNIVSSLVFVFSSPYSLTF